MQLEQGPDGNWQPAPQQHGITAGDVGMAVMGGMAAYETWQRRNAILAVLTPPERERYIARTGPRVLRRVVWVIATVVLTLGPWFTGFWTFFIPTASVVLAIVARRRWTRRIRTTRRSAWDAWARSQGTTAEELADYYRAVQNRQAAGAEAHHADALDEMRSTIRNWRS